MDYSCHFIASNITNHQQHHSLSCGRYYLPSLPIWPSSFACCLSSSTMGILASCSARDLDWRSVEQTENIHERQRFTALAYHLHLWVEMIGKSSLILGYTDVEKAQYKALNHIRSWNPNNKEIISKQSLNPSYIGKYMWTYLALTLGLSHRPMTQGEAPYRCIF